MKLSLATRIFLGYAVVLATFGGVSLFSVAELRQNQREIRLVSQGYLHLSQDASTIEAHHKNQERDTARLLEETNVEKRRALIHLARIYFPQLMGERVAAGRKRAREVRAFAPPSEEAFLREVESRFAELAVRYKQYEAMADGVFTRLERAEPDWPSVSALMAELKQQESSIGRDIRVLHQALETRIRERVDGAEQRVRRTGIAIIGLSVLSILVGLLATAFSARALRPVATLIEGVSRIKRGDFNAQLGVQGKDEIAVLAREFDAMATALRERDAQLKEKQEALLRAEKLAAAGRVSAQVAHEVRNPLSSIGLNVELLEDALEGARFGGERDGAEVRELLRSITAEVDRLAEITEQYLRTARLPQPTLQPEPLNEVLTDVLEFSRPELEQARIQVERRLQEGEVLALMDEGQVRQVFLNLIRNSREAMPDGGTLEVSSHANGSGEVEVEFRDSGRGMAPEVQKRIFEPFFTTKSAGTGLGLAVARQILHAHGGDLVCRSAEGEGTTFTVRLPRAGEAGPGLRSG